MYMDNKLIFVIFT